MQSIADDESYECPHPFLIIFGGNKQTGFDIKPYIFHRNDGYDELTLTSEAGTDDLEVDRSTNSVTYNPGDSTHD